MNGACCLLMKLIVLFKHDIKRFTGPRLWRLSRLWKLNQSIAVECGGEEKLTAEKVERRENKETKTFPPGGLFLVRLLFKGFYAKFSPLFMTEKFCWRMK